MKELYLPEAVPALTIECFCLRCGQGIRIPPYCTMRDVPDTALLGGRYLSKAVPAL